MKSIIDELPNNWVWTNLGDILSIVSGEAFKKKDYSSSGVRLLQIANVSFSRVIWEQQNFLSEDFISKYPELVLQKNDIVMALNRPLLNGLLKIASLKEEDAPAILYQRVARFNLFRNETREYFLHYAHSPLFIQLIRDNLQGSDQPYINTSTLPNLPIPIPPLNEQRRIVAKIEALKARSQRVKEELEAIAPLLDQFRQSVLAAAFRGDLTADWREKNPDVEPASVLLERIRAERRRRWEEAELEKMKAQGKTPKDNKWKEKYEEPIPADTSDLPAIPNSWTWATLPEIGELNRGKSKHRPRNDPALFGGTYPFIQTGEIRNANGVISNFSQTYSEFGLKQSRLWSKGTLCITIAANIAETAILGFPACFPDSIVGFLPETSGCDVRFVEFFMRTAKNDLERFAPATAQKNINLEILRVVAIPFPPLEEQQNIIAAIERYFSVTEAIEGMLSENCEQIQRLDQSILSKAFRGELVPQDPNDEPASVLLERIRAEREKLDTKKKAKSKTENKSRKAKPEPEPKQLSFPGFE